MRAALSPGRCGGGGGLVVAGIREIIPPIFRKILATAVGRTGRSVPVLFQFAEPDVAVADWVIVILQRQREFFRPGSIRRADGGGGGGGQAHACLGGDRGVGGGEVGGGGG